MAPWTDPAVAEALHRAWTTDPRNVDDADRLAIIVGTVAPRLESVLDYGCGTGRMAHYFDPDRYLGYDPVPVMLAVARSYHPSHHFVAELTDGDVADVVVCNSVVQYQDAVSWTRVLADIGKRARCGAVVETYDAGEGALATHIGAGAYDIPVYYHPPQDYRGALTPFGEVKRLRLVGGAGGDHVIYVVRRTVP